MTMIHRIFKPIQPLRIDTKEVLHYASSLPLKDEEVLRYAKKAIELCQQAAFPICIYTHLPIAKREANRITLGKGFVLSGELTVKYLSDCEGAYILLGTVGQSVDRMIAAAGIRSMTDGLMADAAGSAAVEALLDDFCQKIDPKSLPKPRISPGYGDFKLENQIEIFKLLDATRSLGVCLNQSLMISPSKSVSAVVGTGKETSCLI
ncbi:MAG: hypothetical protein E7616_03230 [Ruminococcaceae bacterium]|nr:hypothetical protein [Oscillospiraceae bacterium]